MNTFFFLTSLTNEIWPKKRSDFRAPCIFYFWAFTNKLVRKPPLGPQKNNIIVRKGWRFIDISFLTLLPLKKLRYIFYFWAFTNRLVRKPPLGPQKNNIIGWRFKITYYCTAVTYVLSFVITHYCTVVTYVF